MTRTLLGSLAMGLLGTPLAMAGYLPYQGATDPFFQFQDATDQIQDAPDQSLFISRFVNGNLNFRLIQISNPTDTAVALSDIKLHTMLVGKKGENEYTSTLDKTVSADDTVTSIAAGGVYNLCLDSEQVYAEDEYLRYRRAECDAAAVSALIGLNGNDSTELLVNDEVVDVMGDFGTIKRYGTWSVCGNKYGMKFNELIRQPRIQKGNTEPLGSFKSETCEWEVLPVGRDDRGATLHMSRWLSGDGNDKQLTIKSLDERTSYYKFIRNVLPANKFKLSEVMLRTKLLGPKGMQESSITLDKLEIINRDILLTGRNGDDIFEGEITICLDRGFLDGSIIDKSKCDLLAPNHILGLNANDSIELLFLTDRSFIDPAFIRTDILGDFNTDVDEWDICSTGKSMENVVMKRNYKCEYCETVGEDCNSCVPEFGQVVPLKNFQLYGDNECLWDVSDYVSPEPVPECAVTTENPIDSVFKNYVENYSCFDGCETAAKQWGQAAECINKTSYFRDNANGEQEFVPGGFISDVQLCGVKRIGRAPVQPVQPPSPPGDGSSCTVDGECSGAGAYCSPWRGTCRSTTYQIKVRSTNVDNIVIPAGEARTVNFLFDTFYGDVGQTGNIYFVTTAAADLRYEVTAAPSADAIGVVRSVTGSTSCESAEVEQGATSYYILNGKAYLQSDDSFYGLWNYSVTNEGAEDVTILAVFKDFETRTD